MASVGDILVRLRADTADFVKKMGGASAAMKSFGKDFNVSGLQKNLESIGQEAEETGRAISMKLGLPIAAVGGKSFAMFKDFELALNKVQAVSNATGQEFDALRGQAEQLGLTTKFTASEAAEAMGHLGLAGFKANEILGAMPGTLQLAAAANLDMGHASQIVAGILRGMGQDVKDLGHVNDVLVATFTKTNTELTDLGEAFKYVGPVATQAGISIEDVSAAIGLMGNAGIRGSMAGTSLRMIIAQLSRGAAEAKNPTTALGKAFAELGVNVTDANGKLLPLPDIIAQFEEKLAGMGSETERTAILFQIFGQRAQAAMGTLVEQGSDSLRKLSKELVESGGVAQRVADIYNKGGAGAWFAFKSAVEGAAIAVGEAVSGTLIPQMQAVTEMFRSVAKAVKEASPEVKQFAVYAAEIAIVLGPGLIALGTLTKLAGASIPAIRGMGLALGFLFTKLNPLVATLTVLLPLLMKGADSFARWASGVDEATAKADAAEERYKTVGLAIKDQADKIKQADEILRKVGSDGKRIVSDDYATSLTRLREHLANVKPGTEIHKALMEDLKRVIHHGGKELDAYGKKTETTAGSVEKLSEEAKDAREQLAKIVEDVKFERATQGATDLEQALAEVERQIKDAAKENEGLVPPAEVAKRLREARIETTKLVQEAGKLELKKKLEDLRFDLLTADMNDAERAAAAMRREFEEIAKQKGIKDISAELGEMDSILESIRAKAADKTLQELGRDWSERIEDANPALDEFDRMLIQATRDIAEMERQGKLVGPEVARAMDIATAGVDRLREAAKTTSLNLGKEFSSGMSGVVTGILEGTRKGEDVLGAFKDIGIGIVGKMMSGMIEEKLDFDVFFKKNFLEDLPGVLDSFGGIAEGIFGGIFGSGGSLSGIVGGFADGVGGLLSSIFGSGSGGGFSLGGIGGGLAAAGGGAAGGAAGSALGGRTGGAIGSLLGSVLAQQGFTHLTTGSSTIGNALSSILGRGPSSAELDALYASGAISTNSGIQAGTGTTQANAQATASLAEKFPQLAGALEKLGPYLRTGGLALGAAQAGLTLAGGPEEQSNQIEASHQMATAILSYIPATSWIGMGIKVVDGILQGITGTTFGATVAKVFGMALSDGQGSRRFLGNEVLGSLPNIAGLGESLNFDPYVSGVTSVAKAMERYPELFAQAGGAATAFAQVLAAATDSGQSDAKEVNFVVSTLIDNFARAGLTGPQALAQIATAAQGLGIEIGVLAEVGIAQLEAQFAAGQITLEQYMAGLNSINALAGTTAANTSKVFSAFLEGGSVDTMRAAFVELGTLGLNTFGQFSSYIEAAFGDDAAKLVEEFKTLGIDSMTELASLSDDQLRKIQDAMGRSLGAEAQKIFKALREAGVETMEALKTAGQKNLQELAGTMSGDFLSRAKQVFDALKASGIDNFTALTNASVSQLGNLQSRLAQLGPEGQAIFEALRRNAITNFHELAVGSKGQIEDLIRAINRIPRNLDINANVNSNVASGGKLPEFKTGGVVPGPSHRPVPIIAHGGEIVIPADLTRGLVELLSSGGVGGAAIGFTSDLMAGTPAVPLADTASGAAAAPAVSRRAEELIAQQVRAAEANVAATQEVARSLGSKRFSAKNARDLDRHSRQTRGRSVYR